MAINIKSYQNAYEETIKKLKSNSNVIAVVVYGSMISGDIWEESNIDFLVITSERNKSEMIYSSLSDITLQINYLSKDIFINSYMNILKGGSFHKTFFTGKLVLCRDEEIKEIYLSIKFYKDEDRNIRNIEMLCKLLESHHYTRKYIVTGKIETAYEGCVSVLVNYSRLLMNMKGHITDHGVLSLAVSVDKNIENLYNNLTGEGNAKDRICEILNEVDEFINFNIKELSGPIINLLKSRKVPLSIGQIKASDEFNQVEGNLSVLMEKLWKSRLIRKGSREYKSDNNEFLIDEIIYYI